NNINFEYSDITNYELKNCDGVIISDVLHYLLPEQQEELLKKSIKSLNTNGLLIIRDGIKELEERHKKTMLTEFFSTKVFNFNKTKNKLNYINRSFLEQFAEKNHLT